MYQFLLFDLDGTLTDPKQGICRGVQIALKHFGIEVDNLDELEPFIGPPLKDSFQQFYQFTDEMAEEGVKKYREYYSVTGLFENEIYPGIADMLKKLKNQGKTLAVASSKPTVFVEKILDHFSISSYFDVVVGSELDGRLGTKEEVVEEALRRLEVLDSPEKKKLSAMIGDRKFDVEGAKAYGLTSVAVRYGYAPEGELEKSGANFIVNSVLELTDVLI